MGQFAVQGPILTNLPLVDSGANSSSVTFSISDAASVGNGGGGVPVQNGYPGTGSLGDVWQIQGNYLHNSTNDNSADFFATFGGLSALDGRGFTLVVYGAGVGLDFNNDPVTTISNAGSITVTGGTSVASGSFGSSPGYEEFTGIISGGQVSFNIHSAVSGDGQLAYAEISGAQLLINIPEPSSIILCGLALLVCSLAPRVVARSRATALPLIARPSAAFFMLSPRPAARVNQRHESPRLTLSDIFKIVLGLCAVWQRVDWGYKSAGTDRGHEWLGCAHAGVDLPLPLSCHLSVVAS